MPFHGAVLLIDDTVQEGEENVVAMIPDPVVDDPIFNALHKIRAVIVALDDVSGTVLGTKTASATIELGPECNHRNLVISKAKNVDGFSIGVALPYADDSKCKNLALNIMESMRYRFGRLMANEIDANLNRIKECLQQFVSILNPQICCQTIPQLALFECMVAGVRPSSGVARSLLSLLSNLQMASSSNDAAFTLLPRYAFPIGSCLFRKGVCVQSNMIVSDLVDASRFCLLHGVLSRTKHDGSLVFCRQVFSNTLEQRMLSVFTMGESTICMLFHGKSDESFERHIDPFCLGEMKSILLNMDAELLGQLDQELDRVTSLTTSCNSLPLKLVSYQANKEGVYPTAVIPPKPASAPSSPKIRRRTLDSSPVRHENVIAQNLRKSASSHQRILRFRVVDRLNRIAMESSPVSEDSFDQKITDAFRRAITVIKRRLTPISLSATHVKDQDTLRDVSKPVVEIKNKQEVNAATNQQRYRNFEHYRTDPGMVQSAVHFRIKSPIVGEKINAYQEFGFVVAGKLFPPHHEVYFCFEDSIPQNIADLAGQLWESV